MSNALTDLFIDDFQKNFGEHLVFLRAWDYDNTKKFNPTQVEFENIDKYNECIDELGNINEYWRYSIFFHPNGDMGKTQTTKNRKDADAQTIYCLYADFDLWSQNKDTRPREWFALEPSAIIETYNGYHCYWFLKKPVPVSVYADRRTNCMKFIAEYLNGDHKVTNLARILRVPWFNYWSSKQGVTNEPFRIEVVDYNENLRYTLEDFEKLIIPLETQKKEVYIPDEKAKASGHNLRSNYDAINSRVNAIDVLIDLWKIYWLINNTIITENGGETWWYRYWKPQNAIIDFTWKNRPQGTSFSVAKRFLWTDYETFKYFAEKRKVWEVYEQSIHIKEKSEPKKNEEENEDNLFDDDEPDFKMEKLVPTISKMSGKVEIAVGTINIVISFDDKKIYKISWGEKSEIMDASIKTMGYYVDEEKVNTYIVEYQKSSWESWIIYLSKLWKKAELEKRLSEVGISYFWWNGKVEKALVAYIHSSTDHLQLVNQLWIYDEKMIVSRSWKYIAEDMKGNKYFCNIADVVPADRNSDEIFKIWKQISDSVALQHIRDLNKVYKESIIYSLFTHYAMSFFAHSIRNQFSWLPSSSLVGTTSAGKTYARRLVMQMMGMDECMEIKASTTEFSVLTLCKHYLPLAVWEYSNEEIRFDRDPMLKNNYDGTANTRGTASQKLRIYPNNACFCMDGEVGTMTNSVITRQIALRFNTAFKRGLASMEQSENINYFFLSKISKIDNLRKVYEKKWRPFMAEKFSHIIKAEKERILDNYAMLLAFADCFDFIDIVQDWICEQCQVQFDLLWEDMIDKIIKNAFNVAVTNKIEVQVKDKMLIIELLIDTMKVNKKRYDDLCSSIQNVNYHFVNLWKSSYAGSDRLEIPLDYILKNPALTRSFVSMMEHNARYAPWLWGIEDTWPTISALREFYKANKLEEKLFFSNKLSDLHYAEYVGSWSNKS